MLSQQSQPNLLPPSAPPPPTSCYPSLQPAHDLDLELTGPTATLAAFSCPNFQPPLQISVVGIYPQNPVALYPSTPLEGSVVTFPCNADVLFDSLPDSNINFEDNVGDNHISTNARRRQHYRYSSSGSFLSCAQGAPLPPHPSPLTPYHTSPHPLLHLPLTPYSAFCPHSPSVLASHLRAHCLLLPLAEGKHSFAFMAKNHNLPFPTPPKKKKK